MPAPQVLADVVPKVLFKGSPAYSTVRKASSCLVLSQAGRGNGKSNSLGPGGYLGPRPPSGLGPGHYAPGSTLHGKVGRWGPGRPRPHSAPDDADGRGPGPKFLAPSTLTGPQFSMGARRGALGANGGKLPGPRTQPGTRVKRRRACGTRFGY